MENVINPLDFFSNVPHIFDLILDHLSVQDILNVSLVNTASYKSTTESIIFRRKVKLRVTKDLLECNDEVIARCVRIYHNLELDMNHRFYQKIFSVLSQFDGVKFLELKNCLLTTGEFNRILRMQNNLVELKLDDLTFEDVNLDELANIRELTKLKYLQVKAVPDILVHPLLVKCKNLKRLSIMQLSRKTPIDAVLQNLSNDTQFKLEQFEICDYGYYNFDQEKIGLLSFLERSFETLKVLEFDVWTGISSLQLVFKMPYLQKLRLYELAHADKDIDWNSVVLPRNTGIKYLNLQDVNNHKNLSSTLFKAVPKVEFIEVYALNYEDLQEIGKSCSDLIELNAYFLDINESHTTIFKENLFKNLKRCNIAANDDLRQHILNRNEGERTNFEKLLLVN